MTTDVMLDLETLATDPNCVILTLGAVKFDPFAENESYSRGLYIRFEVDEQIALGRTVSEDTLSWWAQQSNDVREEALGDADRTAVNQALDELNRFLVGHDRVWAQGPVFDIVILENLFRQLGRPCPWQYYSIRDSRTLLKALGDNRQAGREQAHNALADCVYQAEAVRAAVKQYNLTQL